MSGIHDTQCLYLLSMMHNINVWYLWYYSYTMFIAGLYDRQFLYIISVIYLFMSHIHDIHYLYLVFMTHNVLVNDLHPWCVYHDPLSTTIMSGSMIHFTYSIPDRQYFCLVSMIHNICTGIMSVILCIVYPIHPIKFIPIIIEETTAQVFWSRSRPEICEHDPPMS